MPLQRDTLLQHLGEEHKPYGAVTPPIFQNSLFVFDTYQEFAGAQQNSPTGKPHVYSRISNPTLEILEKKVAMLEGAEAAKVFGSGMAAISAAIMSCVDTGSHVVCLDTCYGPTRQFIEQYLPRFGITATFVDGLTPESVIDAIKPETTLIYLESPSTFIYRIQDFEAITAVAKAKGIKTISDNSYCSPIIQRPHQFGVDIVVHSATKYLSGHSDVVAGAMTCSKAHFDQMLDNEIALFGGAIAPFPAWLMLRGLRTLKLRVLHHQQTAHQIATYLQSRKGIRQVHHTAFATGRQRELFEKQMSGSGGLVTFEPETQNFDHLVKIVEGLKIFQLGVSWGGFESLSVPLEYKALGWDEPHFMIRLYCGLEDVGDLIADLDQSIEAAG